ncbi:MAG TPA: hypothetical protein VK907_09000, partial [Phnomibacter sp.]|nr:hypothetical protein [Phnomibacter sp.]
MKKGWVFWLAVFVFQTAYAQQLGVNRASIKWRQIDTDASRVIFPVGQDSIANRVATLTQALAARHRGTIGNRMKKIDIVLQSENTLSNAYVGLGPYRSELYMTPPQDPFTLGANNWADQLAIHEFRHAQQFSHFNVGLSKVGTILGGQYGRAIANGMAVPDWFWEGDAIWNETVHTQQGRGRIPFFFNAYKSLDYGNRQYSWMKLRNGSFKDLVPNHYDLGYLLVSYGREKYGDTLWNKVTEEAASFKGLFYPIEKSVQKHTGVSYKDFRQAGPKHFQDKWKDDHKAPDQWVTGTQKRNVINYRYPYPREDGGIIVLKTSYRQIPTFTTIDANGVQQRIAVKDIGYDDYFSYRNGMVVYAAYQPDPRWDRREYSVIRLLYTDTRQQLNITSNTRYFSPDISADGERIVAVEVYPGRPSEIHVLDLDGNVLQKFTADPALFYSHPKWTEDGSGVVVAARKNDGQMGWMLWQPGDNSFKWLLEPAQRLVGFPVVQGDTLVYTHSANGVDGLYAIVIPTGKMFELQTHGTGIYQGFLRGHQLIGSTFTADGYRLAAWD